MNSVCLLFRSPLWGCWLACASLCFLLLRGGLFFYIHFPGEFGSILKLPIQTLYLLFAMLCGVLLGIGTIVALKNEVLFQHPQQDIVHPGFSGSSQHAMGNHNKL